MWFAALSNYQRNPWLLSFLYRLLTKEESVLDLIDRDMIVFKNAPQNIRVKLYTYRFTKFGDTKNPQQWWSREMKSMYLPPVNKETLLNYLKTVNMNVIENKTLQVQEGFLVKLLKTVRMLSKQVYPHIFINSITAVICTILFTKS